MKSDDLPTLDIRISSAQPGRYSVQMQLGEREFPTGTLGPEILSFGEAGLAEEGTRLFTGLTADVSLRSAWDQAGALYPRRRIRLRIDDAAPELHTLPWETLHDPSTAAAVRSVAADLDTPFSRHVPCAWEPLGPAVAPLKVLTAVAAPAGLEAYGLVAIDRDREQSLLTEALKGAPPGLVQHTSLAGPCTLAALAAELERGYHVLHVVAHGAVNADLTGSIMFLERADGSVEPVDVARFAGMIDCLSRSLRLVVMMSCNTATRSPKDARFGFAPSLLAAGVPAVLAMQDRMPMSTASAFTRAFYEELWLSGQIDRAANRARRVVVTERLPGNAVPALYATAMSLQLWSPDRANTSERASDASAGSPVTPVQRGRSEGTAANPAAVAEERTIAPKAAAGDPAAPFAAWEEFGGPFCELQIVRGAGGCLQAFGLDDDHVLQRRRELVPGGAWSEWEEFSADTTALAVAADARGRVAVFMINGEGEVRHCSADASGKWSGWSDHFGQAEQIAAIYRKDGSLVVFMQTGDELHIAEQRGANGRWGDRYDIAGGNASFIVARNGADHLELFGIVDCGTLWTTVQRRPGGDWDDWSELGADIRSAFAVAGPDGCLHLLTIDVDQTLDWSVEIKPGEGWEESKTTIKDISDVSAVWRRDGTLETFIIDGGAAWHQTWRPDEEGPWQPVGGQQLLCLRAVETTRGEIELFALDESGRALRLTRLP